MSMWNWMLVGGIGFFPINHEEGHLACWGVEEWNILQCVAAHYTSFQWITVYGSALCRNWKWKGVTKQPYVSSLISGREYFYFSSKLKPQNTRGAFTKELFSWLMILMFPWYQKFCHAIMIYGAFGELTFLYFLSANIVIKFTAFWNISPIYRGWLHSLGIARELFF